MTGTMTVSQPSSQERAEGAVARVTLWGSRGGYIGSVGVDADGAQRAVSLLGKMANA